jgi:hypothetical protein
VCNLSFPGCKRFPVAGIANLRGTQMIGAGCSSESSDVGDPAVSPGPIQTRQPRLRPGSSRLDTDPGRLTAMVCQLAQDDSSSSAKASTFPSSSP